jgi:NAD(P)-dependent dehydrogenase (short-subunit alcohol dehydrogenase family)
MGQLDGRTYVVVGGSSGIGLELVRRLTADGAEVQVWSRTAPEELDSLGASHIAVDVAQDIGVQDAAVPERLDGIAYCPGSINLKPFSRLTDDDFRTEYELNVVGAARVLRHVLPALTHGEGSSVVMFSTVAAGTGLGFHASIAAAKAAVEGLGRSLAAELAPKYVRVNMVAPSATDTPLAERILGNEKKREASADRHPLKRVGAPADMAAAARYLLSPESGWMTGQVLHVDGGMSSVRG